MLRSMALKAKCPIVFCNQIGGNDELIFDGGSLAFNAAGETIARGAMFAEDFLIVDTESKINAPKPNYTEEQLVHDALVLGLRDYLHKCGFK